MNFRKIILLVLGLLSAMLFSQNIKNEKDSLYIAEVEDTKEPAKVLHAEPLYIDLIRDLGARKGEKEWNLGLGLTDKLNFDAYEALVEYEWAPIDRLGLEVELPFTFYSPTGNERVQAPSSKLNSLKLALQWSFLVNEEKATTMALGYINELEFSDFGRFGKPLIKGNIYNPFFVVAKRWRNNFHTLVYTGPMIEQSFITNKFHMVYDVHSSFHYMISGTRNFVGVELNKTFDKGNFDMVMRPQMRLGISEQLMLGVVVGIPVSRENERLSSFLRLIWEPKH
ncbi:HAEPLYID family protein [Riemerella anatipestifer]|uniref:HAEPLYID family protein n=1 Tax=Riemerella anatipestifer TaxID=34085 RepID=UPI00137524FE|nr:HAEPLYID family protein [Riemerella anatipestifer]MDY3362958.1 phosphoribosylformylglycinamidine synthase [Riemerella anatipestifer]MDY3520525.1 phosphoribosylformylglycinamidine synthase [Riemerella anatipestifer]MDY3532422.1 phosphoribosylformylglycinamidine synthase [Riemerella anatipestifer]MDY3535023.1 phosphoribosylformylglycinamidine synthase [Riemerella anatipestifer]